MRIFWVLIVMITLWNCKEEKTVFEQGFVLEGIIENPGFDKLMISDIGRLQPLPNMAFNPTTKGYIGDTIWSLEKGFYLTNYGNETFVMYAEPGKNIRFKTDSKNFRKNLNFESDLSETNNFLISTNRILEDTLKNMLKDSYALKEEAFLTKIDSVKSIVEKIITKQKPPSSIPLVTEFVTSNLQLELHTFVNQYPQMHAMQTQNANYQPSENMMKHVQDLPQLNDSMVIYLPNYRQLLIAQYELPLQTEIEKQSKALENKTTTPVYLFLDVLKKDTVLSPMKKDYLIGTFAAQFDYIAANTMLKEVNDSLQKVIQTPAVKNELQEIYHSITAIEIGNKAPSITAKDFEGKWVSVRFNKPTLLYFYSTTLADIDYNTDQLDSLQAHYKDDLQLVSLNFDTEKDWKYYHKNTPPKSIDLHADQRFHSDLAKNYDVQLAYLPRYILVDDKGIIKNNNASQLGSPELEEEIQKILAQEVEQE